MKDLEKMFEESIVRVLVEVKHYISDKDGNSLLTHIDEIETDSGTISRTHEFSMKDKNVVIDAKEIRFYANTKSPISLLHTIKINKEETKQNDKFKNTKKKTQNKANKKSRI